MLVDIAKSDQPAAVRVNELNEPGHLRHRNHRALIENNDHSIRDSRHRIEIGKEFLQRLSLWKVVLKIFFTRARRRQENNLMPLLAQRRDSFPKQTRFSGSGYPGNVQNTIARVPDKAYSSRLIAGSGYPGVFDLPAGRH